MFYKGGIAGTLGWVSAKQLWLLHTLLWSLQGGKLPKFLNLSTICDPVDEWRKNVSFLGRAPQALFDQKYFR